MTDEKLQFIWCRSDKEAVRLAQLFATNLTTSYISHAELQGSRAINPTTWSPEIDQILEKDLLSRTDQPLDAVPGEQTKLIAAGRKGISEVAVFLVTFNRRAPIPYTEVEDMMVASDFRGHGVGRAFMEWISDESLKRGIERIFLESGITNEHAHHFFEEVGFNKVSVVMMKTLQ
jgi:GNAT superfamily N-acetyltransferase